LISNIDNENCKKSFPVLLAEDQEISRKLTEKILHKAGINVTSVENGKKALELFKKQFFPIILSDWMMPEMDGLELCRAIRSTKSIGYVFIYTFDCKRLERRYYCRTGSRS
jgi:two-component system, cell cycle response regulator